MNEIVHLNTEKSRFEADTVYDSPMDLVNESGLNRGQKIAALERWSVTLQDRIRATGEGLAPEAGKTADESALVVEIAEALALLRDKPIDPTA